MSGAGEDAQAAQRTAQKALEDLDRHPLSVQLVLAIERFLTAHQALISAGFTLDDQDGRYRVLSQAAPLLSLYDRAQERPDRSDCEEADELLQSAMHLADSLAPRPLRGEDTAYSKVQWLAIRRLSVGSIFTLVVALAGCLDPERQAAQPPSTSTTLLLNAVVRALDSLVDPAAIQFAAESEVLLGFKFLGACFAVDLVMRLAKCVLPAWLGSTGTTLQDNPEARSRGNQPPIQYGRRLLLRFVDLADMAGLASLCENDLIGLLAQHATLPIRDANVTIESAAKASGQGASIDLAQLTHADPSADGSVQFDDVATAHDSYTIWVVDHLANRLLEDSAARHIARQRDASRHCEAALQSLRSLDQDLAGMKVAASAAWEKLGEVVRAACDGPGCKSDVKKPAYRCSRCRSSVYCRRDCQLRHRTNHKAMCAALADRPGE